jgi:hypothetical protein
MKAAVKAKKKKKEKKRASKQAHYLFGIHGQSKKCEHFTKLIVVDPKYGIIALYLYDNNNKQQQQLQMYFFVILLDVLDVFPIISKNYLAEVKVTWYIEIL